ncbi:flagellar brake protein [Craterilacuibacter sinensis]|uniref:flagellar brake protein n=1 Tax=Craterilacuibacter sinensis TaxID=2686017 RepID=UPI002E29A1D0|nr:flagellar brake protein [Craterilacuibacter sinensis]
MSTDSPNNVPREPGSLDLAQFTLTTRLEIAHHLKTIALSGAMATLFANHGKTFVLTRLLDVDLDAGRLVFDWGGNEEANRQLLASERNVFVCAPEGVKTQCVLGPVLSIEHEGRAALAADLPDAVVKLQRRECFRIQTPRVNPLLCRIGDYPGAALELALSDISLGGMALLLPQSGLAGFAVGDAYRDCHIELKPFGVLDVAFEVRYSQTQLQRNDVEVTRVGCQFLNMTSARENLVQRYIATLERERRALSL